MVETDLKSLRFTKTHEWLNLEGNRGTVGITDHAQQEISDVVFVELPKQGKAVAQGEEVAVVESVKAAFSIYAPIGGVVTQVNDALSKNPAILNRSPYKEGWIFVLEGIDPSEVKNLLDHGQYDQWVKGGGGH